MQSVMAVKRVDLTRRVSNMSLWFLCFFGTTKTPKVDSAAGPKDTKPRELISRTSSVSRHGTAKHLKGFRGIVALGSTYPWYALRIRSKEVELHRRRTAPGLRSRRHTEDLVHRYAPQHWLSLANPRALLTRDLTATTEPPPPLDLHGSNPRDTGLETC